MLAEASQSSSRSDYQRAATSLARRWANDPVAFAREALGETVVPDQEKLLCAPRDHVKTACRSGQKTGKSRALAMIALWWPLTRPRGRVVLTAPAGHQIKNIIWPEVHHLYRNSRFPIGGILHKDPSSGFELPGGGGIICVNTDDPNKLQGLSGANILFCIDEASGFPDSLWDPILGNMAGGGHLLATANPTETSGRFYDAFSKPEFWNLLHISSENTPNVLTGQTIIPGMAERSWVEQMRLEWGVDSDPYQVRVLGNFPSQAKSAIISLSVALAAQERGQRTPPQDKETLHVGVDVARFGDDESVIQPRRGRHAWAPVAIHGADTVRLTGEIAKHVKEWRGTGGKPQVKVDEIGVGAGVVDLLRSRHSDELDVIAVNVAERATADGYSKLRDQLWFGCRDWLKEGGAIPDDPKLFAELVAPTYGFDSQGRQKVESKDEIKKRLKRSPDRADALCLAVYEGGSFDIDSWVV